MHTVAILGAGDLGGALARTLAAGDAVSRIVLVDEARSVAAGKALDIRQTGPIESYDTAIEGTDDIHGASDAHIVVMADRHGQAALSQEAALALVDRVARMAPEAPLVFAGAGDYGLMTLALRELKLPTRRLIGSAPVAVTAAARALMAPALDSSPVDVTIPILGSSRRRFCCFQATPFGSIHPVVFAAPVTLGPSGIRSVVVPELTPRQRVALESTVLART